MVGEMCSGSPTGARVVILRPLRQDGIMARVLKLGEDLCRCLVIGRVFLDRCMVSQCRSVGGFRCDESKPMVCELLRRAHILVAWGIL